MLSSATPLMSNVQLSVIKSRLRKSGELGNIKQHLVSANVSFGTFEPEQLLWKIIWKKIFLFLAAIHDGKLAASNGASVHFRIKSFAQDQFIGSDQHGISSLDANKDNLTMVFDSGHLGCEDGWFQEWFWILQFNKFHIIYLMIYYLIIFKKSQKVPIIVLLLAAKFSELQN